MLNLKKELKNIAILAEKKLSSAKTLEKVDEIYNKYLGRKNGELKNILKALKDLPVSEKQTLADKIKERQAKEEKERIIKLEEDKKILQKKIEFSKEEQIKEKEALRILQEEKHKKEMESKPDFIANNILEAAQWILK